MKIFIIGFMGCGKTTIGRLLAKCMNYSFVDTDRFIEMWQDLTVAEIFARHGEAAFREMERNILLYLQNCESVVISTGGGMPCHGNNMNIMSGFDTANTNNKVVYLKVSPQTLVQRLIHSYTERPLIKGKTETELLQYIKEQLAIREQFYNRADIVMQTEKYTIEEILQILKNQLLIVNC